MPALRRTFSHVTETGSGTSVSSTASSVSLPAGLLFGYKQSRRNAGGWGFLMPLGRRLSEPFSRTAPNIGVGVCFPETLLPHPHPVLPGCLKSPGGSQVWTPFSVWKRECWINAGVCTPCLCIVPKLPSERNSDLFYFCSLYQHFKFCLKSLLGLATFRTRPNLRAPELAVLRLDHECVK